MNSRRRTLQPACLCKTMSQSSMLHLVWALTKVGETSRAHELLEGLKLRLSKMNKKKKQVMEKWPVSTTACPSQPNQAAPIRQLIFSRKPHHVHHRSLKLKVRGVALRILQDSCLHQHKPL